VREVLSRVAPRARKRVSGAVALRSSLLWSHASIQFVVTSRGMVS
jgi:hypothetical protein